MTRRNVILSWEIRRNTNNLWSNCDETFCNGLKTDQFGRCTTLIWTVKCQQWRALCLLNPSLDDGDDRLSSGLSRFLRYDGFARGRAILNGGTPVASHSQVMPALMDFREDGMMWSWRRLRIWLRRIIKAGRTVMMQKYGIWEGVRYFIIRRLYSVS